MAKKIKILGYGGRFAVSEHQQFVDRSGQLVRSVRGDHGKPQLIPVGRAYGFFNCTDSIEEIQKKIPNIRDDVHTSNDLELSLMECLDNLNKESRLFQIAKEANYNGIKYVIEGTFPDAINRKTAEELRAIINPLANSSLIIYQESGKYVLLN